MRDVDGEEYLRHPNQVAAVPGLPELLRAVVGSAEVEGPGSVDPQGRSRGSAGPRHLEPSQLRAVAVLLRQHVGHLQIVDARFVDSQRGSRLAVGVALVGASAVPPRAFQARREAAGQADPGQLGKAGIEIEEEGAIETQDSEAPFLDEAAGPLSGPRGDLVDYREARFAGFPANLGEGEGERVEPCIEPFVHGLVLAVPLVVGYSRGAP